MAQMHTDGGGASSVRSGISGKQPLNVKQNEASASSKEVLRLGSKGEPVAYLQRHLRDAGFYKDEIDGLYGPKTIDAVKLFQKRMGLVADGVVGPKTWATLGVDKTPDPTLPVVVAESRRRPGFNEDGTVANDMKYGDYSKEQIKKLGFMFQADDFTVDLDKVSAEALFKSLRHMSTTLFARGVLEDNIKKMIDRFESNTGVTYSDASLTSAVREHVSTKRFVEQIRRGLAEALKKHNGDIGKLIKNIDVKLIGHPVFNTRSDIVSGLTIAINDTWAYEVSNNELCTIRQVLQRELQRNALRPFWPGSARCGEGL